MNTTMAPMMVTDELVLCKAALVFAITKYFLYFALKLLTTSLGLFSSNSPSQQSSSCCNSSANLRMVKSSLSLTTLGETEHNLLENDNVSCAVCLNDLGKKSQVWELSNCNHVFHKSCLERWLCYDDRLTCPLCRASLLPSPIVAQLPPPPPSWAVERMLYLFGDDLLP